eukprot:SAG31_NODE_1711_length_7472_cov_2.107555_2_plen_56_part_00
MKVDDFDRVFYQRGVRRYSSYDNVENINKRHFDKCFFCALFPKLGGGQKSSIPYY